MTKERKPIVIPIDENPLGSFALFTILTGGDPGDVVLRCQEAILAGLHLCRRDIPFYIQAFESLSESLETILDEDDQKMLDHLRRSSKTITTHLDHDPTYNSDDDKAGGDE